MKFEYKTKISSARSNSQSLRTTIPKEVVQFLSLSKGDDIKWIVELSNDKVFTKIVKN